jgi:signal transduction histidine kinase
VRTRTLRRLRPASIAAPGVRRVGAAFAGAALAALPLASRAQGGAAPPAVDVALLAAAVILGAAVSLAALAVVQWLRERGERRLRAAREAELRAAVQAGADLLWRADAGGRIEAVAAAGDRPLPATIDAAAWRGRALWQLADAAAACPPALRQALEARAPITDLLLALPRADAAPAPWLLAGVPVGSGAQAGYIGIARDLTALAAQLGDARGAAAQAEEIAQLRGAAQERERQHQLATRELESFAHSVSHDLRAPLRVVDGFATILLEDYAQAGRPIDDLGEEHIRRIIGAGSRMNAMIDTLLAMSRMTSRDLERERVDLSQLARELADELKAGDRTRRVEFAIAPGLVVDGDRTLLRLVLQNLLGNAFKFTGRVAAARIEFGAVDDHGRRSYVVRDNGAGFDPRFADKMFGLFQRFHSANEFPGTGVGLATVQRIVRKHGGRIWADSQPGAGAAFYFTLRE